MHDEEENPKSSPWKDNIITKSTSPIKKNTEKINKHACSEETNITTATGIYAKFHFQKHIHNIRVKKNPKTHVNLFQKKQIQRTRNLDHNTQLHTHSYFTPERNDPLKYSKFRKKLNTSESPSKTKNACTLNLNQDTRIHTRSDLTTEQNDFFIHSKFREKTNKHRKENKQPLKKRWTDFHNERKINFYYDKRKGTNYSTKENSLHTRVSKRNNEITKKKKRRQSFQKKKTQTILQTKTFSNETTTKKKPKQNRQFIQEMDSFL